MSDTKAKMAQKLDLECTVSQLFFWAFALTLILTALHPDVYLLGEQPSTSRYLVLASATVACFTSLVDLFQFMDELAKLE